MNRRQTLSVLVLGVAMTMGGCTTHQEKLPAGRNHVGSDDSTFAAGAGRAPSAATSYAFAKILITQGRDRDAMYVLARVIREHPTYVPAYNEMAGVYVRADRLDDAIEVLSAGLKHSPHDGVLQNNLGMCHMLGGKHEKAVEAFTRATELMPTNPTFRANRATALGLAGRDAEAQQEYRTVLGELDTEKNLGILARAREKQPAAEAPQGGGADTGTSNDLAAPAPTEPAPADESKVVPEA